MLSQVLLGTVFSGQLRKLSDSNCIDKLSQKECHDKAWEWACKTDTNDNSNGGVLGLCDLTCLQRNFLSFCSEGEANSSTTTITSGITTNTTITVGVPKTSTEEDGVVYQTNRRLGGWTQYNPSIWPSYTQGYELDMMNFGMMTCIRGEEVHSGTCNGQWSWSPAEYALPADNYGKEKFLTLGGAGCDVSLIDADYIIKETLRGGWQGIDVDVECKMDEMQIQTLIRKSNEIGLKTSITLEGGYALNDKLDLVKLLETQVVTRPNQYNLMFYGNTMWTDAEIGRFVESHIILMMDEAGVEQSRLFPAITTRGVNDRNLGMFLDMFNKFSDLGGLMIWEPSFVENIGDVEFEEGAFGMNETQWKRVRVCIDGGLCN